MLTLDVGPVAHGGHCVARHEGRVVFVRHALPGERVLAVVTEQRRGYWRADAVEILAAAPDRVAPPCPYARPGACGGCDFQHVSHDGQLALKTAVLREQLTRLGGLTDVSAYQVEALPGGPLGWRTRVQYAVDRNGHPGLRAHRSHDVVPIDQCLIAAPPIRSAGVPARRWRGVSTVGVVADASGSVSVYTRGHRTAGPVTHVAGPSPVREEACGRSWSLAPEAFWQVHPYAADTFAATVLDLLKPCPGERCWDLYGGAGLFSAALAPAVGPDGAVTLVELDDHGDAAANLADLPQVAIVYEPVEAALPTLRAADLVVLDPPRAGAGATVVTGIIAAAPRAVAYVACDPAALARDLAAFDTFGYRLTRLRALDLFPMTHHVECVALLSR